VTTGAKPRSALRMRIAAIWPRLRRMLLIGAAVVLVGPIVISLSFNFLQPPTTAMIVRRTVQRAFEGKRPIYPVRDVVRRNEMAPALRRAVLAAEDDRFYLHWGFDLVEIGKALERAERGGRLRGASTITQQVAKNIFLWEGRSYVRKGFEAYLTLVLELTLPKERILDLYLNLAEWGDGVFGAEAAARKHFGRSAKDLTPDQAARLAAVLPAPRRWSPTGSVATRRAAVIFVKMKYAAPRK
jgi:monofunctional glycosyltransferase